MNDTIFYFFYSFAHQSALHDKLIVFFAVYLPYVAVALAALYIFIYLKSIKDFSKVLFVSGIAWVIAEILKILIHIDRPFTALGNVKALLPESGFSFPSAHAAFFSALAFAIFYLNKKTGYWFMLFALVIGMARITAGIHFPIDILGGFVLGVLVATLAKNV